QLFAERVLSRPARGTLTTGYLAHTRKVGFRTVHLWACPPDDGDDYMLRCHPDNQRTRDQGQLRRWCETV
ncbi:unnamed protein product, partial [Hapterophycus canaliculatus]